MRHSRPDAILLAMPRASWDVLASTSAPDVRAALSDLVQVDRVVHVAARTCGGTVDAVVASVHLDAAEAVAANWLADPDLACDADVVVRSVPVGLTRPREVH